MKQTYDVLSVDDAIDRLKKIKNKNPQERIIICTIDFENDSETRKSCSPDEGCLLIRKSNTIVYNGDKFLPHMEVYSIRQKDIKNIIRKGVMHDIIWFLNET